MHQKHNGIQWLQFDFFFHTLPPTQIDCVHFKFPYPYQTMQLYCQCAFWLSFLFDFRFHVSCPSFLRSSFFCVCFIPHRMWGVSSICAASAWDMMDSFLLLSKCYGFKIKKKKNFFLQINNECNVRMCSTKTQKYNYKFIRNFFGRIR